MKMKIKIKSRSVAKCYKAALPFLSDVNYSVGAMIRKNGVWQIKICQRR